MFDLALDSEFSVYLDERNDVATVEGREAFEQMVVIRLTKFMQETLPGITNRKTAKQKIRLEINRVAQSTGFIDSIDHISVYKKDKKPDTLVAEVVYVSGETFSREVNE